MGSAATARLKLWRVLTYRIHAAPQHRIFWLAPLQRGLEEGQPQGTGMYKVQQTGSSPHALAGRNVRGHSHAHSPCQKLLSISSADRYLCHMCRIWMKGRSVGEDERAGGRQGRRTGGQQGHSHSWFTATRDLTDNEAMLHFTFADVQVYGNRVFSHINSLRHTHTSIQLSAASSIAQVSLEHFGRGGAYICTLVSGPTQLWIFCGGWELNQWPSYLRHRGLIDQARSTKLDIEEKYN